MVLLYIACALTISDFEIVSVVRMLIWISIPALAIYIRHDFGHVKSRRQKRPSFLSPQLFHHGLSVSHYLYSCLTSSYNKCIASRNDGYALILSIDL